MGFTWSKKVPREGIQLAVEVGGWKGLWGGQSGPPRAGQMWGGPLCTPGMYVHIHVHTHTHTHCVRLHNQKLTCRQLHGRGLHPCVSTSVPQFQSCVTHTHT